AAVRPAAMAITVMPQRIAAFATRAVSTPATRATTPSARVNRPHVRSRPDTVIEPPAGAACCAHGSAAAATIPVPPSAITNPGMLARCDLASIATSSLRTERCDPVAGTGIGLQYPCSTPRNQPDRPGGHLTPRLHDVLTV